MGKSAKIRHRRLRRQSKQRDKPALLMATICRAFSKRMGPTMNSKDGRRKLVNDCRKTLRKKYGPRADVRLEGDTLISVIPEQATLPAEFVYFNLKVGS